MTEQRDVEEFVEDLVSDGRDKDYILTVARNTRWRSQIDEVKRLIKKFFRK